MCASLDVFEVPKLLCHTFKCLSIHAELNVDVGLLTYIYLADAQLVRGPSHFMSCTYCTPNAIRPLIFIKQNIIFT